MATIAAKEIKNAIADGKNVELVETIIQLRHNDRHHYQAFIDGTEYNVNVRSFNKVKVDSRSDSYNISGIATEIRYQF